MVQNKYNYETSQYDVLNLCQHVGIFGLDGTKWATTEGFDLTAYDFDVVLDDEGNT